MPLTQVADLYDRARIPTHFLCIKTTWNHLKMLVEKMLVQNILVEKIEMEKIWLKDFGRKSVGRKNWDGKNVTEKFWSKKSWSKRCWSKKLRWKKFDWNIYVKEVVVEKFLSIIQSNESMLLTWHPLKLTFQSYLLFFIGSKIFAKNKSQESQMFIFQLSLISTVLHIFRLKQCLWQNIYPCLCVSHPLNNI